MNVSHGTTVNPDGEHLSPADAAAVIDAVERLGESEELSIAPATPDAMPLVIISRGKRVVDLKPYFDQYRPHPERKTGTASLTTLCSFIAHVNRFKDPDSAIYLDDLVAAQPKLIAVIDYHQRGLGHARFGEHRGVYAFPLSEEWKAWTGKAGVDLPQGEFASFLEDRIPDIMAPDTVGPKTREFAQSAGIQFAAPARLLELSRGLSIKVDTQVAQHVNLSTGESQIVFKEEHSSEDGASSIKVPSGFAVQIPVVKNGPAYQVAVRLRYRVSSGRLLWKFALYRTDLIFEEMIRGAVERVEKESGLPVFRGRPEA